MQHISTTDVENKIIFVPWPLIYVHRVAVAYDVQ